MTVVFAQLAEIDYTLTLFVESNLKLTPCQKNILYYTFSMDPWTPDLSTYSGYRYRALAEAIRDAILSEELKPGAKLLAHREMAWRLGVTIGTVAKAYKVVADWGLLTARIGDGTRVKEPEDQGDPSETEGRSERDIDFGLLLPSPLTDMKLRQKAFKDTLYGLGDTLLCEPLSGYAHALGYESHRRAGAALVARSGFNSPENEIIVTAGAQEAIHLILSLLTKPSIPIMTEDVGYLGIKKACKLRNRQIAPVAMDEHGIIPESLEKVAVKTRSKLLFLVPNFQNPTGSIMPLERRKAVVEIAERCGFYILEDNPFWAFSKKMVPPIVSLAPERTFYVISMSKFVSPALRVGYLRALPKFVPELELAKHALSMSGSFLQEEVAKQWIESGVVYELVDWQRREIEIRWEIARSILQDVCPIGETAKPFLWLSLPEPWRSPDFVAALKSENVTCVDSSHFVNGRGRELSAVRIALSTPISRNSLQEGLKVIKRTLGHLPDTDLLFH